MRVNAEVVEVIDDVYENRKGKQVRLVAVVCRDITPGGPRLLNNFDFMLAEVDQGKRQHLKCEVQVELGIKDIRAGFNRLRLTGEVLSIGKK